MVKEELVILEGLRRFKLVQAIFRGAASRYEKVDAISNRTLGAAGASAALLVANIDKLSVYFSHGRLKRCFGFILASIAFGLVQKLLALFAGQNLRVQKRVTQDILRRLGGQPTAAPEEDLPLLRSANPHLRGSVALVDAVAGEMVRGQSRRQPALRPAGGAPGGVLRLVGVRAAVSRAVRDDAPAAEIVKTPLGRLPCGHARPFKSGVHYDRRNVYILRFYPRHEDSKDDWKGEL